MIQNHKQSSARKTLLPFDGVELGSPKQKIRQPFLSQQPIPIHIPLHNYGKLKDKCYVEVRQEVPRIQRLLNELDKRFTTITPESNYLLCWNIWVVLAIIFNLFEIPVALFLTEKVYESEMNSSIGLLLNSMSLLVLMVDLLVRFNISYYQKGKLIVSRLTIFKKYISFQFWIDVGAVVVIMFYLVGGDAQLIYFKCIFYIKIYSLFKIDNDILHRLELSRVIYAIYRLIRLIIFLWFVTTWIATIFFAIDYSFYLKKGYYYDKNQLWLTNTAAVGNLDLIKNFTWDVWYQYALYWALQTSSTVGYGDLTPMNPPQVLYCNLVILCMTVLFAFFINSIWQIIGQLQQSSVQYSENWNNLKFFLRDSKIPEQLKQKISNYLYEIWMDDDDDQIQSTINSMLSPQLRDEFYTETKSKFFNLFPLFTSVFNDQQSKAVLKELIYLITEENYTEGQKIYHEGNYDPYLYYVKKGKIKLYVQGSYLGKQLQTNNNFGQWEFFYQKARTHTAECLSFCKVWKITYTSFYSVIRKYQYIKQKYAQILHRIRFNGYLELIGLDCWRCASTEHWFTECEGITMWRGTVPPEDKQEESASNERNKLVRKNIKSQRFINKGILRETRYEMVLKMHYYMNEYNIE